MKIGDTAPDFEAETSQGRIRLHDWAGDSLGRPVFTPEGFYPGLHDRARLYGQD